MKKIIISVFVVIASGVSLRAQQSPVFIYSGKAIRGFDPVAYFTDGKPVQGKEELKYEWNNATWFFATQQHLDSFKVSPERFVPQYGGYCAYGLSEGHKAPTSPDAWTIVEGKLYLNYNTKVMGMWRKDEQQRIETADSKWPALKNKE